MQAENDRELVLKNLREQQDSVPEGSRKWQEYEQEIKEVIAQNLLEYINR